MFNKECIIYDNKFCDMCGDCNFCDINPDKICDSCGKCLDSDDYSIIQIDELIMDNQNNEFTNIEHSDNHNCNCSDGHDDYTH